MLSHASLLLWLNVTTPLAMMPGLAMSATQAALASAAQVSSSR
jgi:hypothetical protein